MEIYKISDNHGNTLCYKKAVHKHDAIQQFVKSFGDGYELVRASVFNRGWFGIYNNGNNIDYVIELLTDAEYYILSDIHKNNIPIF